MSDSIYAPPEADIAVASSGEADFYVVAPRKFYLLCVFTFNLYFVYWFYRNWYRIKQNTGEDIWPAMRGLFYIFFTHSLFIDVNEKIKTLGKRFAWRPGAIAAWFVLLTITSTVLDRLSANSIGSPATHLVSIVLLPVLAAILLKVQRAINFACEDPTGSANEKLTLANWVWMVLGAIAWLLVLTGEYFLLFEPEYIAG